ncbi:MAG: Gfo/Idh/MocA family oxidoreductase [Spirochaetia bacterium]|nr:Gfo/Idh/MocA family oxidoreductase [Spirochaetia bacterium]
MKSIRIAVVGAGENTRTKHIPLFRKIQGVEISGLVNRSRASSQKAAAELGVPKIYDSWEQAVADPDIDAVLVGTWPYLHAPVSIAALKAGKHVLTEARMAMNLAEAAEMLETSRQFPNLVAQIVPSPYTLAFDETITDLLEAKTVGKILTVDFFHNGSGDFPNPELPFTWRMDTEKSGLNIMSVGIWYEALLRWLGHFQSVAAKIHIHTPQRKDPDSGKLRDILIPDQVDVLAAMENEFPLRFHVSSVKGFPEKKAGVWIYGTEGTLHLDLDQGKLFLGKKGDVKPAEVGIPQNKRGAWRVEEEFVNAIRGLEKVKRTSFEDGVKYMEFTEAIWVSAKENRTVTRPVFPVIVVPERLPRSLR